MILSRCPSCATVFRVTTDQVQVRQGMVRCGHCGAAFNALDTLVAPPAGPPEAMPGESGIGTEPEASFEHALDASESEPLLTTMPKAGVELPFRAPSEPPLAQEPMAKVTPEPPVENETPHDESLAVAEVAAPAWRQRAPIVAWSGAGALLLALGLFQSIYVFRSELARSYPGTRPLLEKFCARFDCRIELPRQPDFLSIEASDLRPDPQRRERLVLAATLKNRAAFAQSYPHLELTLTDARDQILARRVFPPWEYLKSGTDASLGIAANAELALQMVLDAPSIGASGYRLYLFYP